jgi:hypothetical protein
METLTSPEPAVETAESLAQRPEERKAALDRVLQQRGAAGWRIETRSDFQATIARGKRISHALHLILTLVTAGLWSLVWIGVAIRGGVKRRMVTIDEYGNVVDGKI